MCGYGVMLCMGRTSFSDWQTLPGIVIFIITDNLRRVKKNMEIPAGKSIEFVTA
jgi:hypothetical protein